MVLIVVAIPAAMILGDVERQQRLVRIRDGLLGQEDGFARLVPPAWADVEAPGGFVLAVDGEADRARHALLAALVVINSFERRLRRVDVGGGFDELDRGWLAGLVRWRDLNL